MFKKLGLLFMLLFVAVTATGCRAVNASESERVVIFSNADQEAIQVIRETLDNNGFSGQYVIQVLGTSELAGRVVGEGTNIEADIVTLSSFHIESNASVFKDFDVKQNGLADTVNFHSPLLGLEGSLVINTQVMEASNLPVPTSLKDLANPIYAGYISIPDLNSSTTGWLFIQAILENYGVSEGREILSGILENVGVHFESGGSTPIVKARTGEVGIAFGLRHQGIAAYNEGLPIQVIDVLEGNFILTESVAVVNKANVSPLVLEMASLIANGTRDALLNYYPTPLFADENVSAQDIARVNFFPYTLTTSLLAEHIEFLNSAR